MQAEPKASIIRRFRRSVLIWLRLARLNNRIGHEQYQVVAAHNLTPAQFDVIAHLAADPGLSQQGLAERLLVTKGNITGLVDRLQAAGLVERREAANDRRSHCLHLTEKGLCAFRASAPDVEADLDRMFSVLTDSEQSTLLDLLGKLDRALR